MRTNKHQKTRNVFMKNMSKFSTWRKIEKKNYKFQSSKRTRHCRLNTIFEKTISNQSPRNTKKILMNGKTTETYNNVMDITIDDLKFTVVDGRPYFKTVYTSPTRNEIFVHFYVLNFFFLFRLFRQYHERFTQIFRINNCHF